MKKLYSQTIVVWICLLTVTLFSTQAYAATTLSGFSAKALDSVEAQIGTGETAFSTSNLEEIEYMQIEFTINNESTAFTEHPVIKFTADGKNGCSLGNKQSSLCYNDTSPTTWIEYELGTETSTFKDEGNKGDAIVCTHVSNDTDTERTYTCLIDEHYNPNVFKWYDAGYNFADVKWQNGKDQKIHKDNMLKIELDPSNIPLDADQYKLDFRVDTVNNPRQPLQAYLCNSSYTTGDPSGSGYCELVTEKKPNELQDGGTKFRGVFTNDLIDNLGNIKYVVLSTDENDRRKYYALKTYRATTANWTTKWEYSKNNGTSWTPNDDDYESELNLNWFYSDANNDPTGIIFDIGNFDSGQNWISLGKNTVTWNIDPNNDYPPLVDIITPEDLSIASGTLNISWNVNEPNSEDYTVNVSASNGVETVNIGTELSSSVTDINWDTTAVSSGDWKVKVEACEVAGPDFLCGSDTHTVGPDTDSDGISDFLDLDNDNDGILNTDEGCGEATTSTIGSTFTYSTSVAAATANITSGPTAGFGPLTDISTPTLLSATATALGETSDDAAGDSARGTISRALITLNRDPDETLSSASFDLKSISGFDDGLYLELNGVVIVEFDQGDWQDATTQYVKDDIKDTYGNSENGEDNDTWKPWNNEGNPELLFINENGVGSIELLVDRDDGGRDNILMHIPGSTPNPVPSVHPEAGILVGVAHKNYTGPGESTGFTLTVAATFTELYCTDTDNDGIDDYLDLDSDNDGILDNIEAQGGSTYTAPSGSDNDDNGLDDAYELTPGGGEGLNVANNDGDSIPDHLDLDSDNDGIPDNIEAQPTVGYNAPDAFSDSDGDGLNDIYDSDTSGMSGSVGLAVENTDQTDLPDYLDSDSDNDGITDCTEGLPSTTADKVCSNITVYANGLPVWAATDETYADVNGIIANPENDLDDSVGGNAEVSYRETPLPVTIAYVDPQMWKKDLEVTFSTASETSNLGFNVYAVKGKKWVKLNEELIKGSLDSFEPKEYHFSTVLSKKIKKIGLSNVDVNGNENRHGPFSVEKVHGKKTKAVSVNWSKVRKEVKKSRIAKRKVKKAFKNGIVILKVAADGVYEISHENLLEQGIDLSGMKAKRIAISLKGQGIERAISGLNKKGKWTKRSTISFVGEGPDASDALYVDFNHYRLSLNKNLVQKRASIEPFTTGNIVIEENNYYAYTNPSDDPFYDQMFYTFSIDDRGSHEVTFDLPEMSDAGVVNFKVDTSVITAGNHKMDVLLNDVKISEASAQDVMAWPIEMEIDKTLLNEGANTLKMVLYGEDDGFDVVLYDKVTITYEDDTIENKTAEIEMFDKVDKKVLKTKGKIDYLIVSHPLFINETMDQYTSVRQGDGWNVKVVNVEDIYAAYADGMAIPEAIETYLSKAIENGVTHVQLVGAASYDYHDYLKLGSLNFIPSMYATTYNILRYTPCDSCYVMGEDGIPQIAIGRWPVRTLEEFENVVNKTLSWNPSNNTALLIADKQDHSGSDFGQQLENIAGMMEFEGWQDINRVYLDEKLQEHSHDLNTAKTAAKEEIQGRLQEGVDILAYNGHGSTSTWSFSNLLEQSDISTISNESAVPMALAYTCQATYADSPYSNTMAQQLIAAGENGAVALFGASTFSLYSENAVGLGKVFDGMTQGYTLGEAVLNKKSMMGIGYQDSIRNENILGDVTLRLIK